MLRVDLLTVMENGDYFGVGNIVRNTGMVIDINQTLTADLTHLCLGERSNCDR